jgi:hypothetical protein
MSSPFEKGTLPCPFVYANGKACTGHVRSYRLYGGRSVAYARKVRLWCSEKDNHAGILATFEAKERMEFYPGHLREDIYQAIEAEERAEDIEHRRQQDRRRG